MAFSAEVAAKEGQENRTAVEAVVVEVAVEEVE